MTLLHQAAVRGTLRITSLARARLWNGLALVLAAAVAPTALLADTLTVTNSSDAHVDGKLSFREAVEASVRGDTIVIAVNSVALTDGEIQIGHDLTITAPLQTRLAFVGRSGAFGTTPFRIFRVTGGSVKISNLFLYNGYVLGAAGAPSSGSGGGNGADGQGGLIKNGGTLSLTNCELDGSYAIGGAGGSGGVNPGGAGGQGQGGAIYNSGTMTLLDCSFFGDAASGGDAGNSSAAKGGAAGNGTGGAIYNAGTATLYNCTMKANSSSGGRGGDSGAAITGTNGGTAEGGGIYNTGSLTVVNGTVVANNLYGGRGGTGNGMPDGNGGDVQGGGLVPVGPVLGGTTIINTIVAQNILTIGKGAAAGNASGIDVAGTVDSAGHNLIGDVTGSSGWKASDQLGTAVNPKDPKLGKDDTLFVNTLPPMTGSPVTDAGDDAVLSAPYTLTTDARGLPRKVGTHVDIGACETDSPQTGPAFVVNTIRDHYDGVCGVFDCSMTEALLAANSYSGAGSVSISFAEGLHGTTGGLFDIPGITKSMAINGPADHRVALIGSGSDQGQIFSIASGITVTIRDLIFTGGRSEGAEIGPGIDGGHSRGAALLNKGTLTLTSCTFVDNHSIAGAGGAKPGGTGGNGGPANGGAIGNSSTLTVDSCTFMNNSATGGAGGAGATAGSGGYATGGAIYNTATLVVKNSTFANNFAIGGSGGAASLGGDAAGGALYNISSMTVSNCTFSMNAATPGDSATGSGGGIADGGGTSILQSTIVAGNTAAGGGPDVDGAFTSHGFNLIGDGSDSNFVAGVNGDQVGSAGHLINPKLGPLQDNGGLISTFALLSTSPAIDKGFSAGLKKDQRGLARPVNLLAVGNAKGGDGSDIGAFEVQQTPPPTPTPTPTPKATPTPTATPSPPSQLQNLSTRKQVGNGDNVLIGGFIVVGTQNKKVLLRGLGPSLPVAAKLADPVLELHRADTTLLAVDNNWKDRQASEITATGIPPSKDLESAIVATLAAKPASQGGAGYTGLLAGQGGGTGIGLLEIYDLSIGAKSTLANISTRGFVGTGDDLLIGGFIPGPTGHAPLKVLVRALGPSLTKQGVKGALQDPLLELHDAHGILLANDNWKDASNAAEIQAILPPPDDRESAIITTLAPSNSGYTAVVRGAGGSIGVALVEVFAVQ